MTWQLFFQIGMLIAETIILTGLVVEAIMKEFKR